MKHIIGIVEFNDHIASILETTLSKKFKLIVCKDYAELLYNANNYNFSAYVIDVTHQFKDNLQLIYHIRSSELLKHNPIIALVNSETHTDEVSNNVDDYISKPFDPLILRDNLERLVFKEKACF